ncbi:MAG: diacylglyceryl transferase [Flavobacteriaceae bacterium]|nr:diacylglyceryl transferase [Flavobacteriaceae bacterium]
MEKLKQRWGLISNWQMIAIIIVFSLNGSFATWVAKPVTEFFGLSAETTEPYILYLVLRILLIFPIYQITLPLVGWLFGQFKFFWAFEKKMIHRLGLGKLFNLKG